MEAHRSYERFEHGHRTAATEEPGEDRRHGRDAALAVAVMAAFLAIATFLANEAVKEVITGETHRADTSARLQNNLLKIDVVEGNAALLGILGAGGEARHLAAAAAAKHDARVEARLRPADTRLQSQIRAREHETDHANSQHLLYELAEVGLEVGIVLASVSIIARRRWLLAAGGAAATAGVVLILAGLLV